VHRSAALAEPMPNCPMPNCPMPNCPMPNCPVEKRQLVEMHRLLVLPVSAAILRLK
jgi:hypothetical protein